MKRRLLSQSQTKKTMSTYSELQQELMMLWNSRIKDIEGLKENGRNFRMSKPMHYVVLNLR